MLAQQDGAARQPLPPQAQPVLDSISANSLRGNLSFLASDLLEGRGTPSRGLDIAAEYIAAQFRRTGLEPAGDDGYFQTADLLELHLPKAGAEMIMERGGRSLSVAREDITPRFRDALEVSGVAMYKASLEDETAMEHLRPEDVRDKVLAVRLPEFNGAGASEAAGKFGTLLRTIRRAKPKLTLMFTVSGLAELDSTLMNAGKQRYDEQVIVCRSPEAAAWFNSLPPGATGATLTVRLPAAGETHVKLHNVIGLLRGSDPNLRKTYILITAHYDHLGMMPAGSGDRIFNGANDDGSGTVSVIELASALATLQPRPKRSIVFLTFFGEEEGTLGSLYYARHPVFPIEETVADLNLEQVGRTDSIHGVNLAQVTVTGFDYSSVGRTLREAGADTGVRVLSDESGGESFFARSDNAPLADEGIPAHTIAVTLEFPDYHTVRDKWQKIDYDNMAKVDRMVAVAVLLLADNSHAPRWNESNSQAERYWRAWEEHHRPQ